MDSLTHIMLGACVGEAVAGKVLGKKALVIGAAAQSLPDIDFLAYFFLGDTDNLLAHRGITHSLLFILLATGVMTLIARRWFRQRLSRKNWMILFGLNLFIHVFIDGFNAYGIGLFEPFHSARLSFHVLFVADPFFSIWPFMAFFLLAFFHPTHKRRRMVWRLGLAIPILYLLYALFNKMSVENRLRKDLEQRGIAYESFFTTPSPFNAWLWYVVVKDKDGYYTGYRSVFDRKSTGLQYFLRNDSLLTKGKDQQDIQNLLRFAQGFYTVEEWGDSVVFNVLRFGQVVGWYEPREKFSFRYYLDMPEANHLLVQRGRFEKWNCTTITALLRRIRGN